MSVTTRSRFAMPELVASHFHVRDGDLVGDFGAGAGAFLPVLSKKAGSGRVFACEVQRGLVDKIGSLIREESLYNVDPLWCDMEIDGGIKLPDDYLNVAIVVNTLFQIQEKERAILEKRRTLRSGAVLYLVDWSGSHSGIGPHPDCVVCKELAIDLFEAAGFILEREYPAGDYHYGLAFRVL